jgi:hypothetical protein
MEQIKVSDGSVVRRVSNKGGLDRHTTCPYCGMKAGIDITEHQLHPFCGHVEKVWEADNRWYIRFNQFKQGWSQEITLLVGDK